MIRSEGVLLTFVIPEMLKTLTEMTERMTYGILISNNVYKKMLHDFSPTWEVKEGHKEGCLIITWVLAFVTFVN